jgi:hypothetical protein
MTSRRSHFGLAVAGWAAAFVLTVLLALHLSGIIDRWDNGGSAPAGAAAPPVDAGTPPKPVSNNPVASTENPAEPGAGVAGKEPEVKSAVKVETKRLNQEIEVLRENLEKFQHRDRVLFEAVPGMALPIVMTMNPPGVGLEDPATLAKNEEHASITALLGDALTTLTGAAAATALDPAAERLADEGRFPKHPTAIPIYDSARDSGTMVVSNLPPAAEGEVYNLWVTTATGGRAVYVGSLPESSASGADSFDFSLGSTMVLPSGFVLTRDPQNAPASPSEANTVLQGPPVPAP